ncbi:MAG: YciI family protein [Pseudomonadota bacterium]
MTVRWVVMHLPGPAWQAGVDFREQVGVMDHVSHYAVWHADGKLEAGGPFLDPAGGGMMIASEDVSEAELEAFAAADPAVASGLLSYRVRPWYRAMTQAPTD